MGHFQVFHVCLPNGTKIHLKIIEFLRDRNVSQYHFFYECIYPILWFHVCLPDGKHHVFTPHLRPSPAAFAPGQAVTAAADRSHRSRSSGAWEVRN